MKNINLMHQFLFAISLSCTGLHSHAKPIELKLPSVIAPPLPTFLASNYKDQPRSSIARVQIHLTNNSKHSETFKYRSIAVCSASKCWETPISHKHHIVSSKTGYATQVSDIVIPFSTMTDVYLLPHKIKKNSPIRHIKLSEHIQLEADFPGYLLYVDLDNDHKKHNLYQNSVAAFGYLGRADDRMDYIFYSPSHPIFRKLSNGLSIKIPEDATISPKVFSITHDDVGETTPMVGFIPSTNLLKPAQIYFKQKINSTPHSIKTYKVETQNLSTIHPNQFTELNSIVN